MRKAAEEAAAAKAAEEEAAAAAKAAEEAAAAKAAEEEAARLLAEEAAALGITPEELAARGGGGGPRGRPRRRPRWRPGATRPRWRRRRRGQGGGGETARLAAEAAAARLRVTRTRPRRPRRPPRARGADAASAAASSSAAAKAAEGDAARKAAAEAAGGGGGGGAARGGGGGAARRAAEEAEAARLAAEAAAARSGARARRRGHAATHRARQDPALRLQRRPRAGVVGRGGGAAKLEEERARLEAARRLQADERRRKARLHYQLQQRSAIKLQAVGRRMGPQRAYWSYLRCVREVVEEEARAVVTRQFEKLSAAERKRLAKEDRAARRLQRQARHKRHVQAQTAIALRLQALWRGFQWRVICGTIEGLIVRLEDEEGEANARANAAIKVQRAFHEKQARRAALAHKKQMNALRYARAVRTVQRAFRRMPERVVAKTLRALCASVVLLSVHDSAYKNAALRIQNHTRRMIERRKEERAALRRAREEERMSLLMGVALGRRDVDARHPVVHLLAQGRAPLGHRGRRDGALRRAAAQGARHAADGRPHLGRAARAARPPVDRAAALDGRHALVAPAPPPAHLRRLRGGRGPDGAPPRRPEPAAELRPPPRAARVPAGAL